MKLKDRNNDIKKVLIYGADGSGKSTFAQNYCEKNGLNAIVIDIDDTNYTGQPIIDLDLSNDIKTYQNIKAAINEIRDSSYDTIILDGVTSLLELLTSKAKGMKAYKDRADRWGSLLLALQNSGKHLIFVGQLDMEVIFNDEYQSPKPIIKVNSIVNEKYLTTVEKGVYDFKLVKSREKSRTIKSNKEKSKGANKTSVRSQKQGFKVKT